VPLVRRLSLLLLVEGAALSLLGLGYGVHALTGMGDHTPALLAAIAAPLTGLGLLLLGRGAGRAKGWARSPAVVLNVFPLPLSLEAFRAGAWWIGIPLLLLPATVLYLFATPELRETFREG
jgi:hypothetical protein